MSDEDNQLEDDDFGGDDGSVFEDALDEIDLNPYVSSEWQPSVQVRFNISNET